MAVLHRLSIKNFRGIKDFDQVFGAGLTCIIGRGDSGKSTILDAINYTFSSSWGIHFNDSDFYNCDMNNPIVIEGTVTGVPEKLLSQYATHVRGIFPNGDICDDMESPEAAELVSALTIRLTVTKDLEPSWDVVSNRGQEPMPIRSSRRALLNVYSVADFNDRHFSLNKGNPLYALYKQITNENVCDGENKVLDVLRDAKREFDVSISDKFKEVIDKLKTTATEIGISLNEITASLDHRDIAISENKVSIHEEGVPFRLKGKGSKRLLSLAIQMSLTQSSGIILIDEIEQGLEPDRVQHLVNVLSRDKEKQIILTTHSSNVIVEIPCDRLFIMRKGYCNLIHVGPDLQNLVREQPEAFFARKLVVCEGATEVGICRALNYYMQRINKISASCLGVRFVDGKGKKMLQYIKGFRELGYDAALFCDSDDGDVNAKKRQLLADGVNIIDCEEGNSIEMQIYNDVPSSLAKKLLEYYYSLKINPATSRCVVDRNTFTEVNKQLDNRMVYDVDWYDTDDKSVYAAIGIAAKSGSWYKRQDYACNLGEIILSEFDNISNDCCLKAEFTRLLKWIES